jgi:hypothetical protein
MGKKNKKNESESGGSGKGRRSSMRRDEPKPKRSSRQFINAKTGKPETDQESMARIRELAKHREQAKLEESERQTRLLAERDAEELQNPPDSNTVFVCDTRVQYEGGGYDLCAFRTRANAEKYALSALKTTRKDAYIVASGIGNGEYFIAITRVVLDADSETSVFQY